MEILKASPFLTLHRLPATLEKPTFHHIPSSRRITTAASLPEPNQKPSFKSSAAISPAAPTVEDAPPSDVILEAEKKEEKFDWYSNWYPVMPVCDLDKRRPHGKKVIGIDIVVWWDKNENTWQVFEDSCPHRLAPLSEGRIDQWGRLQCVYHGWCFGGAGDCKLIPQALRDGPPVEKSKKACVAVYPSCVQNGIVWFWPNSDPQYKDIFSRKRPPYIPELDDPSYTNFLTSRDLDYGYEVLIENLMDPAHVPYAHYGIMKQAHAPERRDSTPAPKTDREGGTPFDISVQKVDINGFHGKQPAWDNYYVAPCLYYGRSSKASTKKAMLIFYCIPVSPGHCRLIFSSPKNFDVTSERLTPRWMFHMELNTILDSDLYLLHAEEYKLKDAGGPLNWQKACYVPTKSDAMVVAFRRWLNRYAGTQVDWKNKYNAEALPPSPPREQLMDRYWNHTVNCSSCSVAYKNFNALEIGLQVIAIASVAIVAAVKQGALTTAARYSLVAMAVLCYAASKWVAHFAHKTFRYHDYDHSKALD